MHEHRIVENIMDGLPVVDFLLQSHGGKRK